MDRSVYHNRESVSLPCVLMMDYNGWWAPLNSLYYSSSSKVLVSRHPESTIEEIVSHYCPQCLNKYIEDDVHTYRNKCPSCFTCPICCSPLNVVGLDKDSCCFQCGMCTWRSDSSNLTSSDMQGLEVLVMEKERDVYREDAFNALYSSYMTGTASDKQLNSPRPETWNWCDAELAQQHKSQSIGFDPRENNALDKMQFNNENEYINSVAKASQFSHLTTVSQRLNGPHTALASTLLPDRLRLRTKKTLRCRKDFIEREMNILVQPKTFPLEGDSSHKLQQGKWWTKDASAIHEVPKLSVVRFNSDVAKGVGFLHLAIASFKEVDIAVALTAISEEVCNERDASCSVDLHQPFRNPPVRVQSLKSTHLSGFLVLRAYEDELLRDEGNIEEIADFASENESGEWGVETSQSSSVAKLCVPVCLDSIKEDPKMLEVLFSYYIKEYDEQSDIADDKESCEAMKSKSLKVDVRIVIPVNMELT